MISEIEKLYGDFNPGYNFEFNFMDDDYQKLYTSENRIGKLSGYFAGLAIIISCLGLFGLAAFMAEKKNQRIWCSQTLGSTASEIVLLLSGDFTKLIFISILISLPIAFILGDLWLKSFAYHINLKVWYFLSTGVFITLITWITVGMQALKNSS